MPQKKLSQRKQKVKPQKKQKKIAKRKRTSYSLSQKSQVVDYAKKHGRNNAAAHFELDASMIGRWMKVSTNWSSEISENSRRVGSGRKAFFPEAERKLYNWIMEQRKQAFAVTYATIRYRMLEILEEPENLVLYDNASKDFKMSHRWLVAFLKRYKLALRRHTKIFQKLPIQTQDLLEKFQQFVIRLRTEKSFEMGEIFNMDETPVWFDMAGNITVNPKGEKTVHIRATGNEKNRFTVVLTCAAGED
jgi:hypothetical protein